MRVTIGIPVYETFKTATVVSLIGNLMDLPYEWAVTIKRNCYIDTSREECVLTALQQNADRLVMIDTDMQFPNDAIRRLIEQDRDIVGVAYNEKRFPLVTTAKLDAGDGTFVTGQALPKEPFKAAAVGTGLMVINLRRLAACMAPPFFNYETAQRLKLNATLGRAGEDVAFCVRARACGLEVWCDPTMDVHHIGEYPY